LQKQVTTGNQFRLMKIRSCGRWLVCILNGRQGKLKLSPLKV
jgi:hypothetical protein